jgi:hypothetical protein
MLLLELTADLVRDPSRRTSSQSCTGEFISLTTSRRLVFESAGERDLLFMLDVFHATVDLRCQPERWRVRNQSRMTSYVPDVFAELLSGERAYWQVKRGEELERDPTLKGRLASIEEEAARRGATHHLCPREGLREGLRLKNSCRVHAAASAIVFQHARDVHKMLGRAHGLNTDQENALLALAGYRELLIDLTKEFDDDLEIMW